MLANDPRGRSDPLGEALHFLRINGAFYSRCELTAPWGMTVPPLGDLWFHVVISGHVLLDVPDASTMVLRRGDLALVPRSAGHEPGRPCPAWIEPWVVGDDPAEEELDEETRSRLFCGMADRAALIALDVLFFLESVNVEVVEAAVSCQVRRSASRRGARIASMVSVRAPGRAQEARSMRQRPPGISLTASSARQLRALWAQHPALPPVGTRAQPPLPTLRSVPARLAASARERTPGQAVRAEDARRRHPSSGA